MVASRPATAADAVSASAHDDSIATMLRDVSKRGDLHDMRWSRFPYYRDELETLYSGSGGRPLWTVHGHPTPAAHAAIEVLLGADDRALHPDDYDAERLAQREKRLAGMVSPPARDVGWFDAALTVDMLRHLQDVRLGRVNPRNLSVGINVEPKRLDLAQILKTAIDHNRIAEMIRDAEPRFVQYRNLKAAYARYRQLASAHAIPTVSGPSVVKPGERFDDAGVLRRRLWAEGDLPAHSGGALSNDTEYDSVTVTAVRRFQERHGLDADGVLGPGTLAAINMPFERRKLQLELAIERIRWLPEITGGPFIVVNVPSFQLYAFDTLGHTGVPSFAMNVVVGRADLGRQTPIFERDMQYIVFRPYWVIPRSILRKETLPAVRRSSGYMAKNNLEIYSGSGDTGPAVAATPANINRVANGELGMRQKPGPKNALGLAKFIFPNDNNVYMHGTPATELFSRSRRDFSHGCIRLENPERLAVWVLRNPHRWPAHEVRRAMEAPKPQRVDLTRPLPVIIFYTTAVARPDGVVAFSGDIYGHDAKLEKALAKGYPYAP